MPYFHVVVKLKNNKPLCVFKDLSENELIKKFVKPYKLNKPIFYLGNILAISELINIKIVSTFQKHDQELKQRLPAAHIELIKKAAENLFKDIIEDSNDLYSNNSYTSVDTVHGYNDYEIESCGANVTDKFIRKAPGEGTALSKFFEGLKHPWVVHIIPGLIFTLILIYLGIKSHN